MSTNCKDEYDYDGDTSAGARTLSDDQPTADKGGGSGDSAYADLDDLDLGGVAGIPKERTKVTGSMSRPKVRKVGAATKVVIDVKVAEPEAFAGMEGALWITLDDPNDKAAAARGKRDLGKLCGQFKVDTAGRASEVIERLADAIDEAGDGAKWSISPNKDKTDVFHNVS